MKLFFIFILLIYSLSSFAHEDLPVQGCVDIVQIFKAPYLIKLEEHLEWFGASNDNIAKAPCKALKSPSSNEVKNYIDYRAKISPAKWYMPFQTINGVKFKNESSNLIEAFKKLTTSKDLFGIYPADKDQVNFQEKYNINPECEKVRCAIEKIWGEELGNKILYTLLRHNFNTSEFAFANSDRLKVEELDDVLMGLDDLPKALIPLGTKEGQKLSHFSRGYTLKSNGPGVMANAVVMLFDGWSDAPRIQRQYALFHELSHNISYHFGELHSSPQWLELSGWIKKGDNWSKNEKACFASKYGFTNPAEDWAESVSAFRYNGAGFKKNCPAKFEYIKKYAFKGIDYTSSESCHVIVD